MENLQWMRGEKEKGLTVDEAPRLPKQTPARAVKQQNKPSEESGNPAGYPARAVLPGEIMRFHDRQDKPMRPMLMATKKAKASRE